MDSSDLKDRELHPSKVRTDQGTRGDLFGNWKWEGFLDIDRRRRRRRLQGTDRRTVEEY